jgi:hypothetical protein
VSLNLTISVQDLLKNAKTFDVDKIQFEAGSNYLGSLAEGIGNVGYFFDQLGNDALAIRGPNKQEGIYYRSSKTNLEKDFLLKLHEVLHLAYPPGKLTKDADLDTVLVDAFELKKTKGMSDSQIVSNFFKNKCNPDLRTFN